MSSAKRNVLLSIRDGKSLFSTVNIKTVNNEPGGTTIVTVNSDE